MATAPRLLGGKTTALSTLEVPLGFALNFISGRGLLTTRDRRVGPFQLKVLELEIPDIAFPFDVTGGAERFKSRRCVLRHLAFGLDAEALAAMLAKSNLAESGFLELRSAVRDGSIELVGRFAVGQQQADFTMRAALVPRSPEELAVVFYDVRIYGWLPIPAAVLPVFLRRALDVPFLGGERAGAWVLKPAQHFLREILPRAGWKIPDTSQATLAAAEVSGGQVILSVGPEPDPSAQKVAARQPPAAAALAGEGVALFEEAELALGRGEMLTAYERYRDAIDDERGSRWARERLLQIGAADPELALDTRQLAEEMLAKDPEDVQALLALAAIAMRERSWGDAANRYDRLGEIARAKKDRFDAVAAELASAAAAAPVDPVSAIAAYERAAARARDSVIAHRALFELRGARGEWDKAAKAGERLIRLERDVSTRAAVHRRLGTVYQAHLNDLRRARVHFERALRISPDDPGALEGLAETYASRGEPGRAAAYLARLAEQAETGGDVDRLVALNLRLGEIWERWLGDSEAAAARYTRVLDVQPRHRTARIRLAELAERNGDTAKARGIYEELVAFEDDSADPAAIADVVTAYTRLARITMQSEGQSAEVIASLERAVELDPRHRVARDELARALRERGEWSRLSRLLESAAAVTSSAEEARRSRLDAARVELHRRGDEAAAMRQLELVLDVAPDDSEALDLAIPILERRQDFATLMERASVAAETTPEPMRRAQYLLHLARARAALGMDSETRRRALEDALDADPYLDEAAQSLVKLLEDYEDHERLVRALGRLAVATTSADVRADALLKQGRILWQELRRPREAEEALREAVSLEPGNLATWTALSRLLESIGKLDDARAALERGLEEAQRRGANQAPLHERMAELSRAQGRAEDEARELTLAVGAGLRNERIGNRLVQVLSQLGRLHEAAGLLEEWAGDGIGRDNEMMLYKAAELRRSLGEHERASELYRRILAQRGEAALPSARALERIATERGNYAGMVEALSYQVDVASVDQQPVLLERLAEALDKQGDKQSIERIARRLLELNPRSVTGHWHMAEHLLRAQKFADALWHYERLLLDGSREAPYAAVRRDAYARAAGLALEIQPHALPKLQEAFESEFENVSSEALERPLGEILAERGEWATLLDLRRAQVEQATEERGLVLRREIADILHARLNRSEEAIPYYQDVIAASPQDMRARDELVAVFEKLGRFGDLARHLFAMSQLVKDPRAAFEYGLRSVETYIDKVKDLQAGGQVLGMLIQEAGIDPRNERLIRALRSLEMHAELAHVLHVSLDAMPAVDDGRLVELVALLAGPLGQPDRALELASGFVDSHPDSDVPWSAKADVLENNPDLGGLREWLEKWAAARAGPQRTRVLMRLADARRAEGDEAGALLALEEAAKSDPTDQSVLQRLVDRHVARGAWREAQEGLERLAFASAPGRERDERLRRLIEVASDYTDEATTALRGLLALEQRSEDEERHLAQLYIQTGDASGVRASIDRVRDLPARLVCQAAKVLAGEGTLDEARALLDHAMRGDEDAAWTAAEEIWRAAGDLEGLARWRLERAAIATPELAAALRWAAYAELLEAGAALPIDDVAGELALLDLQDPRVAWAAYRAAAMISDESALERSARALESALEAGDPRLNEVLSLRARTELERGDNDAAAALARRLLEVGDAAGEEILATALERAGKIEELAEVLRNRARTLAPADAVASWVRVAQLEAKRGDTDAVVSALDQVAQEHRDAAWGLLSFQIAEARGDLERRVASALVVARASQAEHEAAAWMRRAARLVWREAHDEERARSLLVQAHETSPLDPTDALAEADTATDPVGVLDEALVVLRGASAVAVWVRLAELAQGAGDDAGALAKLTGARREASGAADLLADVAARAEALGGIELAIDAALEAGRLDLRFEAPLLELLGRAGEWTKAIEVLERNAGDHRGPEASRRFEAAARIAREHLGDAQRALALWESSVRAAPGLDNLREAFALALELERSSLVAALAGGIIKRLPEGDEERWTVTRHWVDALSRLSLDHETVDLREGLIAAGHATANDKLVLSRLIAERAPERAAMLLREAATDPSMDQKPELLVEAACALVATGDRDGARMLVEQALDRAVDDLATHELAISLAGGERRLSSLQRFIELEGDAGWEAPKRAEARLELARWRLEGGDEEGARALLESALEKARVPGWVEAMEQTLRALGASNDLAAFWVAEVARGDTPWPPDEVEPRLRQAVEIYKANGDGPGEYRALELLARAVPTDTAVRERLVAAAAELGDHDTFRARIAEQLGQAKDGAERADIALRYFQILVDRFDDATGAIELLLAALRAHPTAAVGAPLRALMRAAGRLPDLVSALHTAAGVATGPDKAALLRMAGGVAHGDLADEAAAYGLYRELYAMEPSDGTARDFCLHYAQQVGAWNDVVDVCRNAAIIETDPETAHGWLVRAADVARDHVNDRRSEADLLGHAVDRWSGDAHVAERLFNLRLLTGDIEGARAVLMTGALGTDAERMASTKLVNALVKAERKADADELLGWFAERHPDAPEASALRLKRARATGDHATILTELERRLGTPKELGAGEWSELHRSAGESALAIGDAPRALKHFVAAIDTADPSPEDIRRAAELAFDLENEGRLSFVIQTAANARELITTRAIEARGKERSPWFTLLGQAHEGANDPDAALDAYRKALELADGTNVERPMSALARLYQKRGDWQGLVQVYEQRLRAAKDPEERAECGYQIGVVWKEYLVDEDRAEDSFIAALKDDPTHARAQLAYGLLAYGRRKYDVALPYLQAQVASQASAPIEHWLALLDCLRQAGDIDGALAALDSILERSPDRADLQGARAEMLESAGRTEDAELAWTDYLRALGEGGDPALVASTHLRLANLASQRDSADEAQQHLEAARQLQPDNVDVLRALREGYERGGHWAELADILVREVALLDDAAGQLERYRRLVELYRDKLSDPQRATVMLERACELAPTDVGLLRALVDQHAAGGDERRFLLAGERLLTVAPEGLDAQLVSRMAAAYETVAGDAARAKDLYARAFELAPQDVSLREKYRRVAWDARDYAAYAPLEEDAIESETNSEARHARLMALADVYTQKLNNPGAAASAIERARQLAPNDPQIVRRLADSYASNPATYAKAAEAYRTLLLAEPANVDLLRIMARLSGQLGETDRAYGYYAALLVLAPSDAEARRFVTACRNAMPAGPQRAISDADRAQGILNADQLGPIEDLFAPLARFAELAHPGNLKLRGVDPKDLLAPTDERVKWLVRVLDPIGVAQAALYLWRGGGFTCDVELGPSPAILVGSSLASDASHRQRAFLVARQAELFRGGHTLAERLSNGDLQALVAALCQALVPGLKAPGAGSSTAAWAQVIAAPMNDQIRAALSPRAKAYVDRFADVDFAAWRRGCVSTANRLAMLVSCDVEDAVAALLRVHGFDDVTDDQRPAVLKESPEHLDLFRFALSDAFFALREALGMALRRAK